MAKQFRGVHTRKTRIIGPTLKATLVHKHNSSSAPLSVTHPKLAGEWHKSKNGPWTPDDFTYGSHVKVWWRCKKGPDHSWSAEPNSRSRGRGCPYCAGNKVSVTNGLVGLFPTIAKEWHPTKNGKLMARNFTASSSERVWWSCSKDALHEWQAVINDRTGKLSGCPFCASRKASAKNNLKVLFPKVASQWHPTLNGKLKPTQVTSMSNRRVWWKCSASSDHVWESAISNRTNSNTKCPYCMGSKPSSTNSLKTLFPRIAAEWHPTRNGKLKPADFTYGSNHKAWFRCSNNARHIWQAAIKSRTRGRGCPHCNKNNYVRIKNKGKIGAMTVHI